MPKFRVMVSVVEEWEVEADTEEEASEVFWSGEGRRVNQDYQDTYGYEEIEDGHS